MYSTWATTKSDGKKVEVFERGILWKIVGPKRNNDKDYVMRNNEESDNLHKEPTVIETLKTTKYKD